ncbi:unnamed protein product, partial [Ectocarpus sp. 4 AP-2014]
DDRPDESSRGELDLPPDLLEEMGAGVPFAEWMAGGDGGGDGDHDEVEEVHVLPEDENCHDSTPEMATCMLRKAGALLVEYSKSDRTTELRMPPQLNSEDRQSLHVAAERLGIAHKSEGEGDQRCLVFSRRTAKRTVAPEHAKVNPHWARSRVKYDIRHWMANFFLMVNTKDSALFRYFCVAVSDAMFMVVPSSRDEVIAHLKFLGLSDDDIKRVRRKYWRSKARYVVPPPAELLRRLTDVYDFFRDLDDPLTGRSFFVPDHNKRFRHEMTYVARGDLSDIPGEEMYIKVGEYKSGLPMLICLRSSSPIEGYHLHLARTIGSMARKASPRWLEAVTNHFDFRWCISALKKQKLVPPWVDHFDLELYDILHCICVSLDISRQVLPGHRPTPMGRQPLVRHGLHFALTATKDALKAQPASADLFSGASSRGVSVGGLHESLRPKTSAAKCFIKDAVKNTAAWDLLKQKDYLALQEGLRTGSNRSWDGAAAVVAPVALPPLPPSTTGRNDSVTAVPLATGFSGARRLHVRLASTQRLATPSACPSCGGATTCSVCDRGAERGSRTGSTGLATGSTTESATSTVAVRPARATDSGVPSGDVATTGAVQVAAQDASRSGGSRPSKDGGVCRAQPRAASVLDQRGQGAALSAAQGPPGYGGAVPARLPSPTLRVPSAAIWPAAQAAAPTEVAPDVGDRIDAVRQATVDARGRVVGAPAAMAAAVAGGASESERQTRPEQVLRAKRPATVAPSKKQKR